MTHKIVLKKILFLVLAMLLCSCAVTGPSFSEAPKPEAKENESIIYVIRNPGHFGSWVSTDIYLNGEIQSEIKEKAFTWFYVKPGKNTFGAWSSTPELEESIIIPAGTTYYFVLDSKGNPGEYTLEFKSIDRTEAESLMHKYVYQPTSLHKEQ